MNGRTRFPLSLHTTSETTARGTGLGGTAGKEDPVELDSSQGRWEVCGQVERCEQARPAEMKKHRAQSSSLTLRGTGPDGEFGWGGTTARRQRSCPEVSSPGRETTGGVEGQKLAGRLLDERA
jgi:hypothetical protein